MRYTSCLPSKGGNIIKYSETGLCKPSFQFTVSVISLLVIYLDPMSMPGVLALLSLQHPILISDQSR